MFVCGREKPDPVDLCVVCAVINEFELGCSWIDIFYATLI